MYKDINVLVEKSINGDLSSREKLVFKLKPLIISNIRKYYNKYELYDDLIQEGYEVILMALKEFDKSKGVYFLGYVKTLLKYHYLNKNMDNIQPVSLNSVIYTSEDEIELIDVIEDKGPMVDEIITKKESNMELLKALYKLTPRQRTVVIMYYVEGKSIVEISKKLNVSYRTIVNTKTKSLNKLKKYLIKNE